MGNFAGLGDNKDLIRDVNRGKNGDFTATVNGVFITGNVAQEDPDWAEFKEFDAFKKPQQTKLDLPAKVTNLVQKPAEAPPPGAKPISLIP